MTRYLYDGAQIIGEYNSANDLKRRFVPAGLDEPVLWYEGTTLGDRRWYAADSLGSIIATINEDAEALTINTYDEYGLRGASNAGRFQYNGQPYISEVGLYHYRARAYSPTLGRFMQTDPILWAGGMNLYAYVGDDPVNWTDPFGLSDQITVWGVRSLVSRTEAIADLNSLGRLPGGNGEPPEIDGVDVIVDRQADEAAGTILIEGSTSDFDRLRELDEEVCRGVSQAWARACWASVAERDAARKSGRPLPRLETGRRGTSRFRVPPLPGPVIILPIPREVIQDQFCDMLGLPTFGGTCYSSS